MSEFFILDTETASLTGGVVEIAWLRVDFNLDILDQHCVRVNPERPIEPGAQAIHGISEADVADCPTLAEVAKLLPPSLALAGHNCGFDERMIKPAVAVHTKLCSLALARRYITGTTNHKLSTLQAELGLPVRESHTALGDVLTVRDLLLHLLPLTGVDLQTLWERENMPKMLQKMPFGAHKGKRLLNVPAPYRAWLLSQADIPKDLRFSLERLHGL